MRFFIAAVPDRGVYERVAAFQTAFVPTDSTTHLEPHVTIKRPWDANELEMDLISSIMQLIGRIGPIEIGIGGVEIFEPRVVYLGVASSALVALHYLILEAFRRCGKGQLGFYEAEHYRPHITLGIAPTSNLRRVQVIEEAAQRELDIHGIWSPVRSLWLYQKDETGMQPYQRILELPLDN